MEEIKMIVEDRGLEVRIQEKMETQATKRKRKRKRKRKIGQREGGSKIRTILFGSRNLSCPLNLVGTSITVIRRNFQGIYTRGKKRLSGKKYKRHQNLNRAKGKFYSSLLMTSFLGKDSDYPDKAQFLNSSSRQRILIRG